MSGTGPKLLPRTMMINTIRAIFNGGRRDKPETAAEKERKTRLAAAVLLLEAAHADDECSEEELRHIRATLQSSFGISQKETEELLNLADRTRETEVDLWQFSNRINTELSPEERLQIMENIWRIIYADGRLDSHEDHFAHKAANLLRLQHSQMIAAKLKAKEAASSPA